MIKKLVKKFARSLKRSLFDIRGMTLIEVLIALAILAIVESAFLGALQTSLLSSRTDQDRITAENLAKSQVDYVMTKAYVDPPSYTPLLNDPTGYKTYLIPVRFNPLNPGVTPATDTGIQKITVEIRKGSDGSGGSLLTIEGYKYKPGT